MAKPKRHLPLGVEHQYSLRCGFCSFSSVLLALLSSLSEFQLFLRCVLQRLLVPRDETSPTSPRCRLKLLCLSAVSLGYFGGVLSGFNTFSCCSDSFRVLSMRNFSGQLFVISYLLLFVASSILSGFGLLQVALRSANVSCSASWC